MGSKGHPPPHHLRRPLPGPELLHPDPYGPGIRPPHGAFPFDMMPHPEIMEEKIAAQEVEMRKLLIENQRLASTHSVLRQELAAAQQELQRLHAHLGAMKADQDQHTRGLIDKMTKMEAELKNSDSIKADLQKTHAEAQSALMARQELAAKAQKLNEDLHRIHGDAQQIPALLSELDALRQEYQHCRATYDYEKKLRIDHYESLQVMEKNYMSMVREVEKLRAELTNAANLEKSGGSYNSSGGYKENDLTGGQRPLGQNAYEEAYGVQQAGAAATYGGPQSGYDPSKYTPATGYGNTKGSGGSDPSKGQTAPASANYDATIKPQAPTSAANAAAAASYGATPQTASPYGSGQALSPYGGPGGQAMNPYGSGQAVNPYASSQAPNPYGVANQAPNAYGQGPTPNAYYGSMPQAPNPYGSAQAPNPYGSTQAPNPYGSAQAPNPYGSGQAPNSYGSGQAPNPYGSGQAPNPYGSGQASNLYGSGQAPNATGPGNTRR